ncbi:hypothetical protein [Microvirga sp. G4-2]|uniref:hypothetical protein n=1 Tax=Microvirga sp. G4-2 TaxID=3434467 RepID=UPI004044B91C
MSNEVIAVFTFKSREHILSVGGTCSWALNRAHARQLPYAVCTRNAHHAHVEGHEPHSSAFLIGRVKDIVPSPEVPGRWLITFSEYAEIDLPNVWKGWRNPVRYTTLEELGIDPATLDFKPMPSPAPEAAPAQDAEDEVVEEEVFKLTIAQAKLGLANAFGVSPDAIDITIRG